MQHPPCYRWCRWLVFLVITWLHIATAIIYKECTLNAKQASLNGAIVIHNPLVARISDTSYQIQVGPQEDDYDIKVSLDHTWGFKSSQISTFQLNLDGFTPPPLQEVPDADLLFIFSVNDIQYFSFFLHLDEHQTKSRIYPSITGNARTVSEWIADNTIHDRYHRVSNNDQWLTLDWKDQALWPLRFEIINNPITNTSSFQFYHNNSQQYATTYMFSESWMTEQNIDIYIMGDSTGERYNISSFHLQLFDDNTGAPTSNTINPTMNPSSMPSLYPSPPPTNTPTQQPSSLATNSPSMPTTYKINYGVVITITFQYKFTYNDQQQIVQALTEFTSTLNENRKCPDFDFMEPNFIEYDNITRTIATILVCDKLQQNEILMIMTDSQTQVNMIKLINNKTHSNILFNKTVIISNDAIFHSLPETTLSSGPIITTPNPTKPENLNQQQSQSGINKIGIIFILTVVIGILAVIILCCVVHHFISWTVKNKITSMTLQDSFSNTLHSKETTNTAQPPHFSLDEPMINANATSRLALASCPSCDSAVNVVNVVIADNAVDMEPDLYLNASSTAGLDINESDDDHAVIDNRVASIKSILEIKDKIHQREERISKMMRMDSHQSTVAGSKGQSQSSQLQPPPLYEGFTTESIAQIIRELPETSDSAQRGSVSEETKVSTESSVGSAHGNNVNDAEEDYGEEGSENGLSFGSDHGVLDGISDGALFEHGFVTAPVQVPLTISDEQLMQRV